MTELPKSADFCVKPDWMNCLADGVSLIRKVRDSGVTIIIVEHIMHVIMSLCDRILCINNSQQIARGTPQKVANNQAVIEAYLGKEYVFREGQS